MTPREGDETRFQSVLAAVVEANTRLVAWRVEQRVPISPLLDRVDFFQHGVIGLAHAALRFRPETGTKFTTYAVPWIDQRVSRAVSFEASLVRDKRNNHSPREAIRTAERVISIEDPEVKHFLVQSIDNACSSELVEHLIFVGQLRAILVGALRNLREKERFVLLARYGFLGMEVTTLEQIGAFLGLTRERVRQIQVRAEERMRTLLRKFEGDLFD
jgi:RNA polymerase nonessential primary-like sigma factor